MSKILKARFSDRQKKMIVAESFMPQSNIRKIAKSHKIELAVLNKWRDTYEHDRLVRNMVQNYISGQQVRPVVEEKAKAVVPEKASAEPEAATLPKQKKYARRTFTDEQKILYLHEAEQTSDSIVMKKYRLADSQFYKWKKQFTVELNKKVKKSAPEKAVIIVDMNEHIDESVGLNPSPEAPVNTAVGRFADNDLAVEILTQYNDMTDKFNSNFTNFNLCLIDLHKDVKILKCFMATFIFIIVMLAGTYIVNYF